MTASKLKIWLKEKAQKAKEAIGPVIAWIVPGIVIGGSMTALYDSRRIGKLEKRFWEHVDHNNGNVDTIDRNFANVRKDIDVLAEQIDNLTRQNNILMEKALQETEGKAS